MPADSDPDPREEPQPDPREDQPAETGEPTEPTGPTESTGPRRAKALTGLPRTWRPLGPRIVGVTVLLGLTATCVAAWISFGAKTRAEFTIFQRGTLVFFGLLVVVLIHALLRSRVELHPDRLVVVNGYKHREFDYAQVVSASMPPGAPWVTLDLADGSTVPVMGIQSSDGNRARVALRELRVMVNASSHS